MMQFILDTYYQVAILNKHSTKIQMKHNKVVVQKQWYPIDFNSMGNLNYFPKFLKQKKLL